MGNACKSQPSDTTLTLVPGVEATVLGREWRCKFAKGGSADGFIAGLNSKAAEEAQKVLEKHLPALKAIDGASVGRIVCGECTDFKVIISAPVDKFKAWESNKHAPEDEFKKDLAAIEGISTVEDQTYTHMELFTADPPPATEAALALFPGVEFTVLGREWRCKFAKEEGAGENGALIKSKSLEAAQNFWMNIWPN